MNVPARSGPDRAQGRPQIEHAMVVPRDRTTRERRHPPPPAHHRKGALLCLLHASLQRASKHCPLASAATLPPGLHLRRPDVDFPREGSPTNSAIPAYRPSAARRGRHRRQWQRLVGEIGIWCSSCCGWPPEPPSHDRPGRRCVSDNLYILFAINMDVSRYILVSYLDTSILESTNIYRRE
jgi:hypothetical protein